MIPQIALSAAILVLALVMVIEVRAWTRGTRPMGRLQKRIRITGAFALEAVLVMVFFRHAVAARLDPLFEIFYWGVALVLAFLVVALVLLDVRATLMAYQSTRQEMLRRLLGREGREE